jgi:hypothetical protein
LLQLLSLVIWILGYLGLIIHVFRMQVLLGLHMSSRTTVRVSTFSCRLSIECTVVVVFFTSLVQLDYMFVAHMVDSIAPPIASANNC